RGTSPRSSTSSAAARNASTRPAARSAAGARATPSVVPAELNRTPRIYTRRSWLDTRFAIARSAPPRATLQPRHQLGQLGRHVDRARAEAGQEREDGLALLVAHQHDDPRAV